MKQKILFLTHHWKQNSHHSKFSGYQALVHFAQKKYDCSVVTWGQEFKVCNENGVTVHYVKPLFRRDFFFSKRLSISNYAKKIQNEYDIVHALYTDCGFFQSHKNFYSTLHVTPFVVRNVKPIYLAFLFLKYLVIEKSVIRQSKKVFVVARNLIPLNAKRSSKYVFVPHGVDTKYWSPVNTVNSKYKDQKCQDLFVLCVGNHGINKKLLHDAIKNNGNTHFIVVGLKEFNYELNNLKILNNISDNELRTLYAKCFLFIRPMDFATANNSILEALSMDCRVLISTPDGSSCDYVQAGEDKEEYFKEVYNNMFLDELKLFLNKPVFSKIGVNRNHSVENFDWEKVWGITDSIYQNKSI